MSKPRAWMSWSSGKDSAFALHQLRSAGDVDVVALLTTVNADADRVAMHAVRRTLLEAQAAALGLPLVVVDIPSPCPNAVYEERMMRALAAAAADGVSHIGFGDLYLADIRAYREEMLARSGIRPLFPLWGRPTSALAADMLASGLRAVLTCVDPTQAPRDLVGRWYDDALVAALPAGVDPCGENGEFHTFVADAPGFSAAIAVSVGETVERDGFVFADVMAGIDSPAG